MKKLLISFWIPSVMASKQKRNIGQVLEDSERPAKKRRTAPTGSYCCVVGCHSNTVRNSGQVKFHPFPKSNQEQAEAWIRAIKRVDHNGRPWRPTSSSVICSLHFFNGKMSKEQNHPAYVPSVFPTGHVTQKAEVDEWRFVRARRRHETNCHKANQPNPVAVEE